MQIQRGWLACALALAACGGKKSDDPAKTGSDKTDKPAPDDNKPLSGIKDGKIIGITGDDIAMLPIDADLVAGVNFQQLQLGGLWKTFVMPMITKDQAKLDEFKAKCGFDPMTALRSASFSLKNIDTSGKMPDFVAVVHGIHKKEGLACLTAMHDKGGDKAPQLTMDGDYVSLAKDSATIVGTWVNDTTFLVEGPHGTKDDLAKLAKGDDALRTAAQFVDMFGKLNPNDSLWFLLKGSAKIVDQASAIGLKPVAVFGTVNAGDNIAADLRLRNADAAEATKAKDTLTALAGQAKNFAPVDKIEVAQDGNDVRIQAMMSGDNLRKAQQMMHGGPPPGAGSASGSATPTAPGSAAGSATP